MTESKEQALNELRTQVDQEVKTKDGSNRFGLFSHPLAGVSGSQSDHIPKKKTLGIDNKPLTMPRGIYGGSPRTGYFSKVGYVSIGDPYQDPGTADRKKETEKKKLIKHDYDWKGPVKTYSDPTSPLYKYMPEKPEDKRPARDANGKVIIENRNIFSGVHHPGVGATTVGHLFSKPYEHISDPYERNKQLEREDKLAKKKLLQEQPFLSMTHQMKTFSSNKETFGIDNILSPKKESPVPNTKKIHDAAFKPGNPSKTGITGTIGKYPEYKSDPILAPERKKEDPSMKKDAFKYGSNNSILRPTPSISLMKANLTREMSNFSRL